MKGGSKMAIMVHFKDNTVCFVPDRDLVELILSDSIVAFRRGAEWVSLADANLQRQTKARNLTREKRGHAVNGGVWRRTMVIDAGL